MAESVLFSNLTSFANSATSVSRSTASSAKVSSANRERQQPKIICFSSPLLNFYANDHIMLNTPVLVRSLKLRNIESVLVWVTTREHWVLLAFLFTPPQTKKQTNLIFIVLGLNSMLVTQQPTDLS